MRRLRVVVLFLVMGVAINVAVAWAFAWQDRHTWQQGTLRGSQAVGWVRGESDNGFWLVNFFRKPGCTSIYRFTLDRTIGDDITDVVPRWSRAQTPPTPADKAVDDYALMHCEHAYGWPRVAFRYETAWERGAARTWVRKYLTGGAHLGPELVLPLRPLGWGFAADTALFAAASWLLIGGPRVLRHWRRRRRGACPACGYDLRGAEHDCCPECGTAVGASSAQATSCS